ncbi:Pycsar system effector family protein [Sphaerisporangium corydalis]|uniref:Pycsar system effector family protein n=1 Tax=Sphaerisporangium corydalis TaxID=1441875 RepID=UPI0021D1A44C|nr:Pycsar system effector family protein [Sphaerisporangium corydalis]
MARPESNSRDLAEENACAYGARLLSEAREELTRADAKAQVLLGIVGLGLGATAAGLFAGSWSPFSLSNKVEWLWWSGSGAAFLALLFLASAVYPRTSRWGALDARPVIYWADILHYASTEEVALALKTSRASDLERVADQLRLVAGIVDRKYRLIRWGFWLLLVALVATLSAALINIVLR